MKKYILLIITLFLLAACKQTKKSATSLISERPISSTSSEDLFYIIEQDPEYNSFLKLVNIASYFETLKSLDNITIFAPTNAAIQTLPDGTFAELALPQNREKLVSTLNYHIVEHQWTANEIIDQIQTMNKPLRLKTVEGGYIAISIQDDYMMITDESGSTSVITDAEHKAVNGIVHGVNRLLEPNINN